MAGTPRPPTALVTGASSGIGRELARQLVVDRGYTVLATARRLDRLEALASELPAGRIIPMAGDLADEAFRARLWAAAEASPGGLDVLINNAGVGHYDDFADQDPARWRQIIEVNQVALFDFTARAIRHMRPRRSGQIVAISSVLGFVGLPYSAAYVASKHAVNGLIKSLHYELRGSGVHAWAACPNRTESEFHGVALQREPTRSGFAEPTAVVARAILRGLDRRRTFWLPTWPAWAVVTAERVLPGPFEWVMGRWAPGHFRKEIERGRN